MTQEILKNSELFTTSDIALAAALRIWLPLEAIDKHNPQRVEFIFKNCEELHKLTASYWRRELRVDPQRFHQELKALKTLIYQDAEIE